MWCFAFVRRLKPGRTHEDFLRAWYPDKGFGLDRGGRVYLGVNKDDASEVLTVGFFGLPEGTTLDELMDRIGTQEAVRHDRIADVVEETTLRALYEIVGDYDFGTDESVAVGRPPGLAT
jgi:hypothetical protein